MIGKITSPSFGKALEQAAKNGVDEQPNADFKDTLKEAILDINSMQQQAATSTELFVRGELTDLHQVMLDAEKARLGLELMLEIRNKLMEGYQEIMRIQM